MSAMLLNGGDITALTLSIKEIADWHCMTILLGMNGGVLEHFLGMTLWADSHVLLAEVLDLSIDIGILLRSIIVSFPSTI